MKRQIINKAIAMGVAVLGASALTPHAQAADYLFSLDNGNDGIHVYDGISTNTVHTFAPTYVGNTKDFNYARGFGINPVDGRMYGLVNFGGRVDGTSLVEYTFNNDLAGTVTATVIGLTNSQINDLSFAPDGTLYGAAGNAAEHGDNGTGSTVRGQLFTVDLGTGAVTPVVNSNDESVVMAPGLTGGGRAIAYNSNDGKIYATSGGKSSESLFSYDPANDWAETEILTGAVERWGEANSFLYEGGDSGTFLIGGRQDGGLTRIDTAGDVVTSFGGLPGGTNAGLAMFSGDLPLLTLKVDTVTGVAHLMNPTDESFDYDAFILKSASGSLNGEGWNSLADKEGGSDSPPAGWTEASSSSKELAELNYDGSSTLAAGATVVLGEIYTPGGYEDLALQLAAANGSLQNISIAYVQDELVIETNFPGLSGGDTNLIVDAEDLANLRNNFGADSAANPEGDIVGEDGQFIGGTIGAAQLAALRNNFGTNYNASAIPEPASFAMLSIGGLIAMRRRR